MAASLTADVLEHVLAFLEQEDRVACTQVSKTFSAAFKNPRIWTNVHLQTLCPQAREFVNTCTHLTTLKITATDLQSLETFVSGIVYPDTITDLTVVMHTGNPGSLILEKLTDAFRCLTSLDVEIVGISTLITVVVPALTLRFFRFWDTDMMVNLSFHGDFMSQISSIQADSVSGFTGLAAVYSVTASSISDVQSSNDLPKTQTLMIEMDEEFALDFLVDAEEVVLKTNGYHVYIDMTTIRVGPGPLKRLTIEGADDMASSVTFSPVCADEFFDFFYSSNKKIDLKISYGCVLKLWPL